MITYMDDLREQITEKNVILSFLNRDNKNNKDKIYGIKQELDKLLYLYYKSLKLFYNNEVTC